MKSKALKHIARKLLAEQPQNITLPVRELDMVWVTKDRRRIRPKDMDDIHLLNSIRMLERKAGEIKIAVRSDLTVAQVASITFPIHDIMVKELESRLAQAEKQNTLQLGVQARRFQLDS